MNILEKIGIVLIIIGILGGFIILDILAFKANIMFGLILMFAFIFLIGTVLTSGYEDY